MSGPDGGAGLEPPGERVSAPVQVPGCEDALEVGRGGYATVYRARQVAYNRVVAVKVIEGRADEDARARFEQELAAMGTLSHHPNIVTVHEAGTTAGGRPYIVMSFEARGSLADRVRSRGPLPWDEAVAVGVKLAGALDTAHRLGVLHRDVKPENVLVSEFRELKLADFGIARMRGEWTTRSGALVATLAYAAPEVLAGGLPSVASDVYSLAATLFALITGSPAFTRPDDPSVVEVIARVTGEPVPDLRDRVPGAICRVLERGMAKRPEQRQPSAAALGHELQVAERRLGLPVTEMIGVTVEERGELGEGPRFVLRPVGSDGTAGSWSSGAHPTGRLGGDARGGSPSRLTTTLDEQPAPAQTPGPAVTRSLAAGEDAIAELRGRPVEPAPPAQLEPGDRPPSTAGHRRRWTIVLVVAVVASLAAGAVTVALRGASTPPAPASGGTGTSATGVPLKNPKSVAVDRAGDLYIADTGHSRVLRVSGGLAATLAGDGTPGFSGDGGPAASARLNTPQALAVDGRGDVFIADATNGRVRRVDAAGVITTVAGGAGAAPPSSGDRATAGALDPDSLAVDAAGDLYVSDGSASRVYRVDPSGTIAVVAGNGSKGVRGDGGPATAAELDGPKGLAVDAGGSLFIADSNNARVRRVSPDGTISTVAGTGVAASGGDGGPAVAAPLAFPVDVAAGAGGDLYILDVYGERIRRVDARSGVISTVAGSGSVGAAGDGGPATAAQLSTPAGVAVDARGDVYIADTGNDRVRRVDPRGRITTAAGIAA